MCRGNWNGARRVSLVHFFVPILGVQKDGPLTEERSRKRSSQSMTGG